MTEKEFYNKVIWINFILSVLVVMVHSFNMDLFMEAGSSGFERRLWQFQSLISASMPTMTVTGFFILSGYLFCRGLAWENLSKKMVRRVGTVLVPYIAWNTLYYLTFSIAGRFPALWDVLGREQVPLTLSGLADAIINYTYNPVLWYLKQLIILIALVPVIYLMVKKWWVGAAALTALFIVVSRGVIIPVLNLDALFYYSLGCFLAIHGKNAVECDMSAFPGGRFLRAAVVLGGLLASIMFYAGSGKYGSIRMLVLYAVISPITLWNALPAKLPKAAPYMRYGLFLYCFHFLAVRGLNKIGALILPHTVVTAAVVYMMLPVICVLLTWGMAVFLQKKIPPLWRLLGGGR